MHHTKVLLWACIWLIFAGCQQEPAFIASTEEFVIKDGFTIEHIAGEPLLASPMAMAFDERGRIWVVELPGYMRDIDGSDEELPDGRIVILEDADGDGKMDKRKVFLDALKTPRAIALAYGGLLYTETPNLWWVPIEGDHPGERELVDSLYVVGGNIEHQPNGLLYNLDNWLYSAKSNARYRRIDGEWKKEATSFRGQWGITHDDEGRLYYNSNSNPLQGDFTFPNQFISNPYHKANAGVKRTLDLDRRLYPIQATSVNRGYNEGVLDERGFLRKFTSACGPLIYKGDQFPEEFYGNAFACGPEANLVKRYILRQENGRILAEQAYSDSEFLVSRDESFRPVNLYNGLDGAMYVLDLRKGVIQHRAYMSNYLREEILSKKLDSVTGKGRIYRITSDNGPKAELLDLESLSPREYVNLLSHPNGRLRIFAQQQLIFGEHGQFQEALESLALEGEQPFGQIHALWTLEGLGLLSMDLIEKVGGKSNEATVLTQILRFAPMFQKDEERWSLVLEKAIGLDHPKVNLQLCYSLGQFSGEKAESILMNLAKRYQSDELYSEALVSGMNGSEQERFNELKSFSVEDTLTQMLAQAILNRKENRQEAPQLFTAEFDDRRTKGFNLYSTFCASCHGLDGHGVEGLAPPIYHSEFISQSTEQMILIALHGLKGPIEVRGKRYEMNAVMPGIKDNPALTDDDIAAILSFVRNSLSEYPGRIRGEDVSALREKTKEQKDMFTAESLKDWLKKNGVGG